eukprot:COSAG06_NODE_14456_length_1155_cov_0.973485_2_plen_130_part_00
MLQDYAEEWWIDNVFEELDAPNEFWFNASSGQLYLACALLATILLYYYYTPILLYIGVYWRTVYRCPIGSIYDICVVAARSRYNSSSSDDPTAASAPPSEVVPAPSNISGTTCQIQTGWSPCSERRFEH